MGASRVKIYCDEIVISDVIIRTVNLEMKLFPQLKKVLLTNIEISPAQIIYGLIVDHESNICVF